MIGHLAENPPRLLGGREIKGQWREQWLNLAMRVRPKHLERKLHSSMIATVLPVSHRRMAAQSPAPELRKSQIIG